ncbi:MAG TPA: thiamine-phosphate kinase [Candidatus Binataceae bacterium]|nr:thiamine-phosphate kinase [Candidatus Binataceae bacterium]
MAGSAKILPGEFELIARLCAGIRPGRGTIIGPGDDCAVLAPRRRPILFTIDSMVEGVHFKLKWAAPHLFGARALTVNLSDIAAMGGRPAACVVNLALPKRTSLAEIEGLYTGLRRAARMAGVDIVGGNITRASELSITIALIGYLEGRAMRRDTARPGDEVFVTGTIGDAAIGWRILAGKFRTLAPFSRKHLVERYVRPAARLLAGERLAGFSKTPTAIDISDGLLQDLGHILEQSRVGADISPAAIPLSTAYRKAIGDDLSLALFGGEDYELLFCLPPGHTEAELSRRLQIPVHRIGKIVRGRRLTLDGKVAPRMAGWDHFRRFGAAR